MLLNLVDSHVHLDAPEFNEDRDLVIARALEAGVSRFITIGAADGFESAKRAIALAERHPFIWASVGIHPHDGRTDFDVDKLRKLASHPRVVAIGETGLDFFRDWCPANLQEHWFRAQVELAKELKKPIVIHSRDAGAQCYQTLYEMGASEVGGVFHCYAEDADFAFKLAKINFLVSFPGVLTFKKSEGMREIAKKIPLSQIMLETDAPFMAPEPVRGKRCESAFMAHTAKTLATVKGVSVEEIALQTTNNAKKLFKIS